MRTHTGTFIYTAPHAVLNTIRWVKLGEAEALDTNQTIPAIKEIPCPAPPTFYEDIGAKINRCERDISQLELAEVITELQVSGIRFLILREQTKLMALRKEKAELKKT